MILGLLRTEIWRFPRPSFSWDWRRWFCGSVAYGAHWTSSTMPPNEVSEALRLILGSTMAPGFPVISTIPPLTSPDPWLVTAVVRRIPLFWLIVAVPTAPPNPVHQWVPREFPNAWLNELK